MTLEPVPGSVEYLELLIEDADGFAKAHGIQVMDGYMPFAEALPYILTQMQAGHI